MQWRGVALDKILGEERIKVDASAAMGGGETCGYLTVTSKTGEVFEDVNEVVELFLQNAKRGSVTFFDETGDKIVVLLPEKVKEQRRQEAIYVRERAIEEKKPAKRIRSLLRMIGERLADTGFCS